MPAVLCCAMMLLELEGMQLGFGEWLYRVKREASVAAKHDQLLS